MKITCDIKITLQCVLCKLCTYFSFSVTHIMCQIYHDDKATVLNFTVTETHVVGDKLCQSISAFHACLPFHIMMIKPVF